MRRLIVFILLVVLSAHCKPIIRFKPSDSNDGSLYTLKIMQVADLHYGEGENTDWGPEQDVNSTRVLSTVIPLENPDLVVYTGDQLTGNNINANATAYWSELVQPCVDNGTPWAMVFGNHDDAPLETQPVSPSQLSGVKNIDSRYQLLEFDRGFPLSLSQQGPLDLFGVTNYYLPVLGPNDEDSKTPLAILYMLDSGGGTLNESITAGQVSWYLNQSVSLQQRFNQPSPIPALLFVHIPMEEYKHAWTPQCGGLNEDGVSPVLTSSGLFDAIVARGDIRAVFVGHDHGNTWCCPVKGVSLCYGRHSGYGGYGDWDRGTRIIEMSLTPNPPVVDGQDVSFGSWTWTTWVRMENGTVLHQ